MSFKVRKQIYLNPEQEAIVKQVAASTGASEAEIIRQAISRYAMQQQFKGRDLAAWERLQSRLKARLAQGQLPGKRTWRREDLYDRKVLD